MFNPRVTCRRAAAARICRAVMAAGLALGLSAPAGAEDAEAGVAHCPGTPLQVSHRAEADLLHACEAWRRVAGFLLEERGLRVAAPIRLVFADHVALDLGGVTVRVLGYFDRARRAIRLTSWDAAWLREPDQLMFGQPVDAELHTSLVAHELAHAVLSDNFRMAVPYRTGEEYMAYVVQLSTMEPATRARVLAGYPDGDFAALHEINQIRHVLDPHDFGVRAWRHFTRAGHGWILDMILSGQVGIDPPP